MQTLAQARAAIRARYFDPEDQVVDGLLDAHGLTPPARERVSAAAEQWVRELRESVSPTLMEAFLAEYGLST